MIASTHGSIGIPQLMLEKVNGIRAISPSSIGFILWSWWLLDSKGFGVSSHFEESLSESKSGNL